MTLHYQEAEPIILGSGELYLGTVANPETASEATIEAALVNVGAISSGATLTYSPKVQKIRAGNRGTIMSFITDEEVTFDCGVITWVLDNITRLAPATLETDGTTGKKTLKLKSMGTLPVNYLRFIHQKKNSTGTITLNIYKAQQSAGFKFTFDSENPLEVGYEFTALSDKNGNYLEIVETFEGSATLTLTSIAVIPNTMTLASGETGQINVIGVYNNDFNNQVNNPAGTTFASDNELVATVDSTGLVSYVGAGTATITATNGTLTDTCVVTCS